MNAGLHALLAGSIDYAGMFPPAKLSLEESLENYLQYRDGWAGWLLGRLVMPVAEIPELRRLLRGRHDHPPLTGSGILTARGEPRRFLAELSFEIDRLRQLRDDSHVRFRFESLELLLPAELLPPHTDDAGALIEFLSTVVRRLRPVVAPDLTLFCEAPAGAVSPQSAAWTAACAAALQLPHHLGFKLRTGGPKSADAPPPELVASIIEACSHASLCWKATAGLHGAFSRNAAPGGEWAYGFLNLFAAAVIAQTHAPTCEQLVEILISENPDDFQFDENGIGWRKLRASVQQIESARQRGLRSFGSCSFEEPSQALDELTLAYRIGPSS